MSDRDVDAVGGGRERDRAAEAFTDAFRVADAEPFAALDPAELARLAAKESQEPAIVANGAGIAAGGADAGGGGRTRPRWLMAAVAAVVVLVVAVPLGVVVLQPMGSPATASRAEAGAAAAPAESGSDAGGGVVGGSAESGPGAAASPAPVLPGPAEDASGGGASGTRTESLPGGVQVEVPASWGRAPAPWSDWCAAGSPFPTTPYVGDPPVAVRAIACPDPIPADQLALHLTWVAAGEPTEVYGLPAGWSRQERTVGGVTLVAVAPDAEAALAASVLDSAREG